MQSHLNRLELVRTYIDNILNNKADKYDARCGFVHLYSVAGYCSLLAHLRNLNCKIASVIGMLHDISTYITGDPTNHAKLSVIESKNILSTIGCFSEEEINIICTAIGFHSNKLEIHSDYDELLKDADVLQHYLYNTSFAIAEKEKHRLDRLIKELKPVIGCAGNEMP